MRFGNAKKNIFLRIYLKKRIYFFKIQRQIKVLKGEYTNISFNKASGKFL